jgi:hypothetical protein
MSWKFFLEHIKTPLGPVNAFQQFCNRISGFALLVINSLVANHLELYTITPRQEIFAALPIATGKNTNSP